MSDMPNVIDQDCEEPQTKTGSVIFCRLPPTSRITETITLVFYPLFFGGVMSTLISGVAGHILGAGLGLSLAIIAITFRRWGARWAISHVEERKLELVSTVLNEGGGIAPHNNMVLLAEIFYMTMEVYVVSILSSYFLYEMFVFNINSFYLSYDILLNLIDYLFTHYHGLDYEINKHIGSIHKERIYLIKYSVLLIVTACIYGSVLMSIRFLLGWKSYIYYIRAVSSAIYLKNESKVLFIIAIFSPLLILAVHSLQSNGLEYFLLMDKVPDASWYLLKSLGVYILAAGGLVLFLYFQLAIIISYLVLLCVNLFLNSFKNGI